MGLADKLEEAKKSGNVLTQSIDDNGNLIGVNTQEHKLKEESDKISTADIRKELFEGDNIVTKKSSK